MNAKAIELEERLVRFSLSIIEITESMPNNKTGSYLSGQLIRSGLSPAFNYGEAQVAESRLDFIHKMKICLKELKESFVCLKIIHRKPVTNELNQVVEVMKECSELISIFVRSIETAKKNGPNKN
jgi:four helix bundle protein